MDNLDNFCKLNKNSQQWYFAWGNLQEVFVMLVVVRFCFVMLLVVLHSLLFDVIPHPSVSYCRVLTSILYFQSSSLQSDFRHFHFNFSGPFFHSFTVSTLVLSGHFFTYRCFLPYAPSPCLCHKLLSSRTLWEPAGFP